MPTSDVVGVSQDCAFDSPRSAKEQAVHVIGGREKPGGGSAQTLLSALLTAGCFQVVRHRHDLKFSALPQWYHTEAPFQIRHTVRYDLQPSALVVCDFEQPVGQDAGIGIPAQLRIACQAFAFLPPPSLRGPPVRC